MKPSGYDRWFIIKGLAYPNKFGARKNEAKKVLIFPIAWWRNAFFLENMFVEKKLFLICFFSPFNSMS